MDAFNWVHELVQVRVCVYEVEGHTERKKEGRVKDETENQDSDQRTESSMR